MAVQTEVRKFKVAEFYKLGEMGILSEDDPVELLLASTGDLPTIASFRGVPLQIVMVSRPAPFLPLESFGLS